MAATPHPSGAAAAGPKAGGAGGAPSAWQLIRPYWVSEDRWPARSLLFLVFVLSLGMVYINVRINSWYAANYNALDKHDYPAFKHLLLVFIALASAYIVMATARTYFRQMLEFRWRQWMTDVYLARWLHGRAFYRLERDRVVDNPDQRISEDLRSLATNSLALSLDLVSNFVTLLSFVTILWVLSGTLSFTLFGHAIGIPGYMVWFALVYAIFGTLAVHRISRRLVDISYRQQRVEADFRVLMVRLRENAEQIAFYDGGPAEGKRARAAFLAVRQNWWDIMRYTKRLVFASSIYGQLAIIFPMAAAAPRYFAGGFSLGVLMQLMDAFGQVSGAFSWFISNYSTLADWKATVNRLREFDLRLSQEDSTELVIEPSPVLSAQDLHISKPDGESLGVPSTFKIGAGERWLVRGPSGAGKSTLLRTVAGLWPYAEGHIGTPSAPQQQGPRTGDDDTSMADAHHALFLPQRSYVPDGTLKEALCYPESAARVDDAACAQALRDCNLADYIDQLDVQDAWARRLSPGEQQRLSFARALLLAPRFLFLDEATSSLDTETEAHLYEMLVRRLPDTTVISIAHRNTLERFHTHEMRIGPQAGTHALQPATAEA
jgi:putative ATP-binding cassette transporter